MREVEDLPVEEEKVEEVICEENEDFISLSHSLPISKEPLCDSVIHLLASTEKEEKTVRSELQVTHLSFYHQETMSSIVCFSRFKGIMPRGSIFRTRSNRHDNLDFVY